MFVKIVHYVSRKNSRIFCGLRKANVIVQEVGYIIDDEEKMEGNSGIELCMRK